VYLIGGTEQQPGRKVFTHEEIAQMIGSSRETVTRLLTGVKKAQHHPDYL
jgi:CRP-like cAMP-binding protein